MSLVSLHSLPDVRGSGTEEGIENKGYSIVNLGGLWEGTLSVGDDICLCQTLEDEVKDQTPPPTKMSEIWSLVGSTESEDQNLF